MRKYGRLCTELWGKLIQIFSFPCMQHDSLVLKDNSMPRAIIRPWIPLEGLATSMRESQMERFGNI